MFEILIIVVVLLVVFGASKVRSAGTDLGAAVKGFRKALRAPPEEPPAAGSTKDDSQAPSSPAHAAESLPDAEFPETLAAREHGSRKPRA